MEIATDAHRLARARAWIATILVIISMVALVVNVIVAGVPALAGLLVSASGVRRRNPCHVVNRLLSVICAVVVVLSVLVSLLLLSSGNGTATSTSVRAQ